MDPVAQWTMHQTSGAGDCGFKSHLGPQRGWMLYIPVNPEQSVPMWQLKISMLTKTLLDLQANESLFGASEVFSWPRRRDQGS